MTNSFLKCMTLLVNAQEESAVELPSTLMDLVICNWFYFPLAMLKEFKEFRDIANERINKQRLSNICINIIDLVREDMQLDKLDSSAKEMLQLFQKKEN